MLRVNEKYRYNNIFVIITVTNLSGIISKDTMSIKLLIIMENLLVLK